MHKSAHEAKNGIETLESANGKSIMSKTTYEKLTWLVSEGHNEKFKGITPKEWQDVLKRWEQDSI